MTTTAPPPGSKVERKAELRAARSALEVAEQKARADLARAGHFGAEADRAATAKAKAAAQERADAAMRTYRAELRTVEERKQAEQRALEALAAALLADAEDLVRRAEREQRFAQRFADSVHSRRTETAGDRPEL